MIIFSSTIRRREMSPAGVQAQQQQPAPTTAPAPTVSRPKKFQVVPVPGDFIRGRWKCVDTRGGSTGVFGNYPEGAEYESIITFKNNKITVRRKFYRIVVKTPEEIEREKNKNNVTVVNKTLRDAKGNGMTSPGEEIEVIIMSPQEATRGPVVEEPQSSTVIISSQTHTTTNPALEAISNDLIQYQQQAQQVAQITPSASKDEDEGKKNVCMKPRMQNKKPSPRIAASTSNTVHAIDNKIVQAMDLVKTHLTFAVREEVETLRSHISDLESRLSSLREENRQLREHVAPEVLAFIQANTNICKMIDPVNNIRLAGPEAPDEEIPNDPVNVVEGARRYSPLSPPLDARDGYVNEFFPPEEEMVQLVQRVNNGAQANGDGYHDSDNEHEEEEEEHNDEMVQVLPAPNPLLIHREPRYIPYSPADTPSSSNSPNFSSGTNSPINHIALFGVVEDVYCRDDTMSPGEIVSAQELFERGLSDLQFSEKICVDEVVCRKRKNGEEEEDDEDMEPSQKRMHFGVMKLFHFNSRRDPPDDPGAGPSGTQSFGTNNNDINNRNYNML